MKRSSNNKNEKTSTNKTGSRKGARASEGEVRANEQVAYSEESNGKPSVFACPECSGVLWELKEERLLRYRCRVGHSYTADSLKSELDESAERALWAAMRSLEEKAAMTRRMMDSAKGPKNYVELLKDRAESDTKNAEIIRNMIFSEQ